MNDLSKNQKIALLGSYLSLLPPRWSAQQNYIAMYFTIVLAIYGFAATQAADAIQSRFQIIICIPLFIAALISWFARLSIKKQERHIRELIVVTAKLEHSIGLYERLSTTDENEPWPNDHHTLPRA